MWLRPCVCMWNGGYSTKKRERARQIVSHLNVRAFQLTNENNKCMSLSTLAPCSLSLSSLYPYTFYTHTHTHPKPAAYCTIFRGGTWQAWLMIAYFNFPSGNSKQLKPSNFYSSRSIGRYTYFYTHFWHAECFFFPPSSSHFHSSLLLCVLALIGVKIKSICCKKREKETKRRRTISHLGCSRWSEAFTFFSQFHHQICGNQMGYTDDERPAAYTVVIFSEEF